MEPLFEDPFLKSLINAMSGRNTTYATYDLVGAIIINEGHIAKAVFGAKWPMLRRRREHACKEELIAIYDLADSIAKRTLQGEVFDVDRELGVIKQMQDAIIKRL